MFHTNAWLLWLAAAVLPFTLTRNPYYLVLALLALGVDYYVLCRKSPLGKSWGVLLWLGISVALLSVLYNVLFVSVGATKLATLPAFRITFSEATLQIGGAITLESLVYGLVSALSLIGLLVAFAVFNAVADHYQLLRSAPRFLYQSAIVLSIAITFVPQLVLAHAEIREAQMLRGHRFRSLRDLLPLFVTLLAEGLEHSITLAESMTARGFGSITVGANPNQSSFGGGRPFPVGESATAVCPLLVGDTAPDNRPLPSEDTAPEPRPRSHHRPSLQIIIAVGLFALLCGVVALTYIPDKLSGSTLVIVGAALLAGALWRIGSKVQVSRYRRVRWTRRDMILATACIALLVIWGAAWWNDSLQFLFYPYPRLKMPPFDPLLGAALVLLATPAVLQKLLPHD